MNKFLTVFIRSENKQIKMSPPMIFYRLFSLNLFDWQRYWVSMIYLVNLSLFTLWRLVKETHKQETGQILAGSYTLGISPSQFFFLSLSLPLINIWIYASLNQRLHSQWGFLLWASKFNPELKWNSYIRLIAKNSEEMVGSFYGSRN